MNTLFQSLKNISVIPRITLQCACGNCKPGGAGPTLVTMTRLEDAMGFSSVGLALSW